MRSARRKNGSVTRTAITFGGVATLALTAACGGGKSSTDTSGGSKTFVMAVQALPTTLDIKEFSGGTRPLLTLLDSMLVNYDTGNCDTAPSATKLVGQLAESWTASSDRKSVTFKLKNVKSQYGNQLTSEDVKWSLQRGIALSPIVKFLSSASAHFSATNPIEVVSPTEFKLNLDRPTPVDVAMWTVPTFSIFDSTEAKKHVATDDPWANKWLEKNSASFGPWQVQSFETGNQITLTKNPGWPDTRGNYDQVVLKQITGSADQAQLLTSGSVNFAKNLTWSQFSDLKSNNKVAVYACAPVSRDWLVLQQANPKLADVRVRQAISMAIDRDALVKGAYAGLGKPALNGLLESQIPTGATVQTTKYDVAAAKALLAQAGYATGFELTLNYNAVQPGSQVDQLAILLQSQLAQIGITLKLNKLATGNDLQSSHSKGTYEAELWSSSGAMPSTYFDVGLMEPGAPNTTWGYTNQDFVKLVDQLGADAPGSPSYNDTVVKLANLSVTDMPVIQLVSTPNIFAMSAGLKNVDASLRTIMTQPQPAELSAP